MSELQLQIDGKACTASVGETILTVAKRNQIEIPTLCYHPLVAVYGACGVCLVEAEGSPKLMRACATEVRNGMVINTKSERAEKGRKLALELLFSDHKGDCRPPCVLACPAHTDCQGYVGLIANGEFAAANALIKEQIPLPASIGRVCPHPCETACRRQMVEEPIAIAALKRFAGDMDLQKSESFLPEKEPATGKTVAIIGGGPAGLTMGYYLAQKGHGAEIFEVMPKAGGMLRYGIPQYRLPKEILDQEIALIEKMGVKINCNQKIGKDILFEDLEKKFDAVYIAIGAWQSAPLRCEGEDAQGVLGGIDFLIDVAQQKPTAMGKNVAVVGGGNTAMDACRTAMRLGAEKVTVLYRRTRQEMPAEDLEITEAMEEGIDFRFLVAPLKVETKNGKVCGITLQKMELGEADAGGRRRPIPIEGAVETLPLDTIIAAIGQKVVPDGIPVKLTDWHTIAADTHTYLTDRKGVFAGGDGINKGPGIAVAAIGHAKEAAEVVDSYLKGDIIPHSDPYIVTDETITAENFKEYPQQKRAETEVIAPHLRKNSFKEVAHTFSEETAKKEGARCLECGCADYYECKLIHYGQAYQVEPQKLGGEVRNRRETDTHPFIERNADKCILCGLCVRVCEEVSGAGALGLVHRGFDTIIQPEFGTPLINTDCISCGECVALCPTGALLEKTPLIKRVPLAEDKIPSVCAHCGLGCETELAFKGKTLCRILPTKDDKLCEHGRFGFIQEEKNRITAPQKAGTTCSLEEAIALWQKNFRHITDTYGKDSVAVCLSSSLTMEELAAAKTMGEGVLKTSLIGSLTETADGAREILGKPANTSYEDIKDSDFLLYVGEDLMKTHPVFGMDLRLAKIPLGVISQTPSLLDDITDIKAEETSLDFLKAVAFVALKDKSSGISGYQDFKTSIATEEIPQKAQNMGEALQKAKNPTIVWDKATLPEESAALLGSLALALSCKKTLTLEQSCNSRGLVESGFLTAEAMTPAFRKAKAAFIIGENDLDDLDLSALEYTAVMATHITPLTAKADLVLPLAPFTETTGTLINSEGKAQKRQSIKSAPWGKSNVELFTILGDGKEEALVPLPPKEPHFRPIKNA